MRYLTLHATAALAVCGCVLFTPASFAGGSISFTITSLVLEGDVVAGVGLVTRIDNIAVNSHGQWIVEADTARSRSAADGSTSV